MLNLTLGALRASIATSPSYFCRAHGSSRVAAFALATVLGACHSNDAAGQAPTDANSSIDNAAAVSTLERELNPQVSAEDKTTLASDNAAFAFDLYRKLKETDGNLAFSPASISLALAMTYAGAAATTASEMARTLHFTLPPERLHRAFNDLDQTLASRGQGMTNTQEGAMRLNIANSVWLEQTLRVLPSFLDVMAVSYGAGVNLVSFLNDAGAARVAINAWVANHTAGKIAELLAPGEVDGYTRMVLANAVYFNAAWLTPFNALNNHANSFTLLDGTITTKKYMYGLLRVPATQAASFVAASLPYQDTRLSMVVVVPDPGKFAAVESSLDGESFAALVKGLMYQKVSLYLPPFNIDTKTDLSGALISLGMRSAFSPSVADFSAMVPDGHLSISKVVHEAFVNVAEKGTEAGAATAVVLEDGGITGDAEAPPLLIKAERPFLYFIYDNPTGAILFMGRALEPIQN